MKTPTITSIYIRKGIINDYDSLTFLEVNDEFLIIIKNFGQTDYTWKVANIYLESDNGDGAEAKFQRYCSDDGWINSSVLGKIATHYTGLTFGQAVYDLFWFS